MKNVWQLYQQNGIEEPQLKENKNVMKAYLGRNIQYSGWGNINAEGCLYLNKVHWPNLKEIDLSENISIFRREQH